jgi:hypothetical protein
VGLGMHFTSFICLDNSQEEQEWRGEPCCPGEGGGACSNMGMTLMGVEKGQN